MREPRCPLWNLTRPSLFGHNAKPVSGFSGTACPGRIGYKLKESSATVGRECTTKGGGVIKKILLATVGLMALGLASPASAADLPARTYTKAPAPMVAIYDWTGF